MNVRSLAVAALVLAMMGAGLGTASVARTARYPVEAACTSPPAVSPIYAGASEQVVQTPRGPIGFYRFGRGSPIVLVTGFRATISEWDAAFLAELAKHHDVVAFDNRGIGRSIPNAATFTVQDMARDTAALIGVLKLHRPTVLGWSMGGSIVQQLAIDHPGAVGRIVLMGALAPGAAGVPVSPNIQAKLSGTPGVTFDDIMAVLFPAADAAEAVHCFRQNMYHPDGYRKPVISSAVTAGQSALIEAWESQDAAAAALPKVHIAALILSGADDAVVSGRNAVALRHLLPESRLLMIDNAGHAMMYQYPVALAREISSFAGR
jgi:pimeloyl-ACP methyl ester carboxylesterase